MVNFSDVDFEQKNVFELAEEMLDRGVDTTEGAALMREEHLKLREQAMHPVDDAQEAMDTLKDKARYDAAFTILKHIGKISYSRVTKEFPQLSDGDAIADFSEEYDLNEENLGKKVDDRFDVIAREEVRRLRKACCDGWKSKQVGGATVFEKKFKTRFFRDAILEIITALNDCDIDATESKALNYGVNKDQKSPYLLQLERLPPEVLRASHDRGL